MSGPYTLTLTSGSTSVSGQVMILDDTECDTPETYTLTIDTASLPGEIAVENDCQLVVTITHDRK